MADEEYDFIFKVLLLGDSDVGKGPLLLSYVDKVFSDTYVPTIGVDFRVKTLELENKKIKMQIWDTAGQERFRNVISSYFRGAHGILLIYDVNNRDSFKSLEIWLEEIEKNAIKNVSKILIGNKNDLPDEKEVKTEEGEAFAKKNGMQFIETSCKMNINVTEAFETLAKLMIEHNTEKKLITSSNDKKVLSVSRGKSKKTKKKCY